MGRVEDSMNELFSELFRMRSISPREDWRCLIQSTCLMHSFREIAHQEPVTRRAFSKPCGYPGDAGCLDLLYFPDRVEIERTTELGMRLFRYITTARPAAQAARERLKIIAKMIGETALSHPQPRILSVACGYLRELEYCEVCPGAFFGQFVGLDQDRRSLEVANECYSHLGITTLHGSVLQILTDSLDLADFDLVYAAGLYDYLKCETAQKLTNRLMRMVRPGGKLLIANFSPELRDIGYMEAFMDWQLVYRTESDMLDILAGTPHRDIGYTRLFANEGNNISYLTISKTL